MRRTLFFLALIFACSATPLEAREIVGVVSDADPQAGTISVTPDGGEPPLSITVPATATFRGVSSLAEVPPGTRVRVDASEGRGTWEALSVERVVPAAALEDRTARDQFEAFGSETPGTLAEPVATAPAAPVDRATGFVTKTGAFNPVDTASDTGLEDVDPLTSATGADRFGTQLPGAASPHTVPADTGRIGTLSDGSGTATGAGEKPFASETKTGGADMSPGAG